MVPCLRTCEGSALDLDKLFLHNEGLSSKNFRAMCLNRRSRLDGRFTLKVKRVKELRNVHIREDLSEVCVG